MNKKHISLKFAVIIPFIALITLVLSIEAIIWKFDYNFLAKEQGSKIVHALNETTQERLKHLLTQPLNANMVIRDELLTKNLNTDNLEEIQVYLHRIVSSISGPMPQVSALGYGDEFGNYIGLRIDQNSINLMVKDMRTDGNLNIYSDATINSEVLASYEKYDPRERPWYKPVKENPIPQWSDIYVNYDEQMESTITFLAPVTDDKNNFKGVMAGDIKLDGINDFLKNDKTKGNGVIYIIDESFNIIAHSGNEDVMTTVEGDPPSGTLMQAADSENNLINTSAKYLLQNTFSYDNIIQHTISGTQHYMLVSKMREPENLNWRVIVVIPESDLMGEVQQRNQITFGILILISIMASGFGLLILNNITNPIIRNTNRAVEIAHGNWSKTSCEASSKIREIDDLSSAIAKMGNNIKDSFEELEFKEERYRSLVENVDSMIYSLSVDGKFLSLNQSFERILDHPTDDLIGQHFSCVFTNEENIEFWTNFIGGVTHSKEKQTEKFEYYDSREQKHIISATLIPLLNDKNDLIMLIGANTDITELITAQEQIAELHAKEKERLAQQVEQKTEELNRAMSELLDKEKLASLGSLVSGISHEINTPLGVAVSAASLLETNSEKAILEIQKGKITKDNLIQYMNSVDETATILSNNLKRASDLVKSFKNIAVNQSSETKLHFNIYDYIQSVLLSLKHEYKGRDHTFEIICNKELRLYSYSGAFSQILTNLIMNSIIHGFKEIKGGHIRIEVAESKDNIKLIYTDDGVGMPEEVRKRVFEPFFTTNRNQGGSGLGLNIVYNLVTGQLGGKISCYSSPEKGTTFTIELEKE